MNLTTERVSARDRYDCDGASNEIIEIMRRLSGSEIYVRNFKAEDAG